MDRKSFAAAAKRLEEVDQVVRNLDPAIRSSAFGLMRGYVAETTGSSSSIEELVLLVLRQAAESAQDDLRAVLRELERINAQKARLRDLLERVAQESDEVAARLRAEYDDLFVTTDECELESLRLQMALDRQSKMIETLSNILKKMSDTERGIIDNIK
jgi:methyl-accepting chemotaxis protein